MCEFLRLLLEFRVVLPVELAGLRVQRTIWVRVEEETVEGEKHFGDFARRRPVRECVNADSAVFRDIRMKNGRRKFDLQNTLYVAFALLSEA